MYDLLPHLRVASIRNLRGKGGCTPPHCQILREKRNILTANAVVHPAIGVRRADCCGNVLRDFEALGEGAFRCEVRREEMIMESQELRSICDSGVSRR